MRAIRYHDEARLELVHEVSYYTAVSAPLGERFDKAIQSAAKRAAEFPDLGSPYFHGTRRVFPRKVRFSVGYMTFLCRLIADSPEDVIAAFVRMQDNLRHPRKTTRECFDTLAAQGLKKFAGMVSASIE